MMQFQVCHFKTDLIYNIEIEYVHFCLLHIEIEIANYLIKHIFPFPYYNSNNHLLLRLFELNV